jgi:hypothetical protein
MPSFKVDTSDPWAGASVFGLMLFPGVDEQKQRAQFALYAREHGVSLFYEQAAKNESPMAGAYEEQLARYMRGRSKREQGMRFARGINAGGMLLTIRMTDAHYSGKYRKPYIHRVAHALSVLHGRAERTFREDLNFHRSAAPLWGAYVWKLRAEQARGLPKADCVERTFAFLLEDLPAFLAAAEDMRSFGDQCFAGTHGLWDSGDASLWQVVTPQPLPFFSATIPSFSSAAIEALESYRMRIRY